MKYLTSIKLTIILLVVLISASIIGSLLEQDIANKLIYHSFWFIGAIAILALNITLCTVTRFKPFTLKRLGFILTHTSILIIIIGALVGILVGEKGFVKLSEGESSDYFLDNNDEEKQLPFTIHLDDFILEKYADGLGKLLVSSEGVTNPREYEIVIGDKIEISGTKIKLEILRYVPDFIIDLSTHTVTTKSQTPNNPAIEVKIDNNGVSSNKWLFSKFHGFHGEQTDIDLKFIQDAGDQIKDYKSKLTIFEDSKLVLSKTIEVNDPLSYKGYTFYQASYDPENLSWSGLQVVKDPGLILVYLGFILLVIGLIFIFYIKPALIRR